MPSNLRAFVYRVLPRHELSGMGYGIVAVFVTLLFFTRSSFSQAFESASPSARFTSKLHPALFLRSLQGDSAGTVKAWVIFTDKGFGSKHEESDAVRNLTDRYNPRALKRRALRRTRVGLLDAQDLPVSPAYLAAVARTGVALKRTSHWVNAVSVIGTRDQLARVCELPFVKIVQPVRQGRTIAPVDVQPIDRQGVHVVGASDVSASETSTPDTAAAAGALDYGLSFDQLNQIGLVDVHNLGHVGAGVVIGVLDTGFQRSHIAYQEPGHALEVIAEYDFIDDDPITSIEVGDPPGQHSHGTIVLSTIAAYKPGELVGGAFDASFILCKTEDTTDEYPAEEDNFVAGLEFIEANGGDLATASLGYIDWYTQADLDGMTAVTTIGVNTAIANGVFCLSAAGNQGHDADPNTSNLIAPADALKSITVGAVSSSGAIVSFSSDGPTADGRVKPEVTARGLGTATISSSNDTTYSSASGTSLSTPLVAAAVACLVGAHPEWSVDKLRNQLFFTASRYVATGASDPQFVEGYGIVDALGALQLVDCNNNGVADATDIALETSDDLDENGVPDECQTGACCFCGAMPSCQQTAPEDCGPEVGVFYVGQFCSNVICPNAAPTSDDCVNAETVTAGEYSFDTRCATTDGPITETDGCVLDPADAFQQDIWFTFTATCDGLLDVSAINTDFDALVAVYCDGSDTCLCPADASTEYACNQQGDVGSAVQVQVQTANCYTIRLGGLNGAQGTGTLRLEATCLTCLAPTPPRPETTPTKKNRYLSFFAGDAGIPEAIRVTLVDLPPPFEAFEGRSYWVGPPRLICSSASQTFAPSPNSPPDFGCGNAGPDLRVFVGAKLQCEPFSTDWTQTIPSSMNPGLVHVYSGAIVPNGTYEVQTVAGLCAPTMCSDLGPLVFSDPLTLSTSKWGDVVGHCQQTPCSPPNAITEIIDVVTILNRFSNTGGASKPRTDIGPDLPDLLVQIDDVTRALDGFTGKPYPFPFTPPCP